MHILFWTSLALLAYPYAIYPALLVAFNRLIGRRPHAADPACQPTLTIILPVHNEARRIEAKRSPAREARDRRRAIRASISESAR